MIRKTSFYSHERTFWYSSGVQSLFLPVGTWVEPPEGSYGADTPASKRRFLNLLNASSLAGLLSFPAVEAATEDQLLRVHTPEYLEAFQKLSDTGGGDLGDLAPFSAGTYEVAKWSTGLAIRAVDDVVRGDTKNGYALCRPSGHHCLPGRPKAFALLANIAIAIEDVRSRHQIERIAVVDWDVHHGNETQSIFYSDPDILTISIHQRNCLGPGQTLKESLQQARGEGKAVGSNVNIPLP
jgi:acetoin utilization deacetylase AcuC-like enzyme